MKIIGLFFLFLSINLTLEAQETEIHWLSFDELHAKYRENPKPTLLFIYTDWCKYCKIQENTTFKDKKIVEALNGEVYAIKLNAENKELITFFGRGYEFDAKSGFHSLASYLGAIDGKLIFPTTVALDRMMEPTYRKAALVNVEEMNIVLGTQ